MEALLIDLGWKSALIASVVLLAYRALRRRPAGERVWMLRIGIGALLALPLLALIAPPLELAVLPAEEAVAVVAPVAADAVAMAAEPEAAGALDWIVMLYCAGAAIVLLRLSLGLFTLWRWTRTALPASDPHWLRALARATEGLGRPVRLLVSRKVAAPLSWGLAPAWILIAPETEAHAAQAEAVLAHEMAHVRRFDWPMLMLAQVAAALLWFNPLVWWLGRMLAAQIELAADEEAIGQVARLDYAQTLLAVGAGSAHYAACGMTYARNTLGQRIRDVLEAAPRRSASRSLCAAMLIAAVALAGPLAVLRLVPVEAQAAPVAALESFVPAIIPAAQAEPRASQEAPRLVSPRKRRARGIARVSVAAPQPKPLAALPQPVAPTAPAPLKRGPRWEQTKGMIETRRAAIEARHAARAADMAQRVSLKDRGRALGMTEAANGMRIKARTLERVAADPSVSREIRNEHVRTASNLRRRAQTIDEDARRLILKP